MKEINAYAEIGGIAFEECFMFEENATVEEIKEIIREWAEETVLNELSWGYEGEDEEED